MSRVLIAICLAALVALPASALAGSKKGVDITALVVDRLDEDYARQIIEEVCAMGDSDIGFRGAGGPSDHEAAFYIRDHMEEIGLVDVAMEVVPVDAWEFRGAYLEVPGVDEAMVAASFGGFPGTDGPLTAEVVWVNNGYDADYQDKDVEDKIVLVNWIGYDFWVDSIAYGAWEHGAAGIIITTIDSNVGQNDYALSCHDGLYVTGWPPLISISPENATIIIEMLRTAEEPLIVTMVGDIVKTPMNLESPLEGGYGYNVVGYLPGQYYGTPKDEFVIFGPHHDAWFRGAMDDTSAIASMLVLAKAMVEVMEERNWQPLRTVIFTSHTAEEYGIDDTYYDWCWGAYYQITYEHADDWVGRTVAYLCMELMGMAGVPVYINTVPELYTFMMDVLADNTDNMPYGVSVDSRIHCWADHWTFAAAGIPSLEFETVDKEWEALYYHSNHDAPDIIDYDYLLQLFAIVADMTVRLATAPVAPYDYSTLSWDLRRTMSGQGQFGVYGLPAIYEDYGFDTADNLDPLIEQVALFSERVTLLQAALPGVKPGQASRVNTELMAISGVLGRSLIGMGVWEQDWFPYQQPINDVYHLYDGIAKLEGGNIPAAIATLTWVGMIWYYPYMSYGNYLDQRDRLTGDRVASWGLQTHLQLAVDIWPEYDSLVKFMETGEEVMPLEDIITSLEEKLETVSLVQVENSFELMWTAVEDANQRIEALLETI